jgi:biotin operon repressor
MIKERIGTNAGKIWRKLDASAQRVYSCEYLADELNITEKEVYMAVGWLAREGKIVFDETGDTVSLPVCPYF